MWKLHQQCVCKEQDCGAKHGETSNEDANQIKQFGFDSVLRSCGGGYRKGTMTSGVLPGTADRMTSVHLSALRASGKPIAIKELECVFQVLFCFRRHADP